MMWSGLCQLGLLLLFGVYVVKANDCSTGGKTIADTTNGYISSPPLWSKETSCLWVLRIPRGKYLRVKFTKFELRSEQACPSSYVELTYNGTESLRYCGKQLPPEMTFSGPTPLVVYHGIGRERDVAGFRMEFQHVDTYDDCRTELMKCRNGRCVDPSKKCDSVDDCGDGTDEEKCNHKLDENLSCGNPAIKPTLGNGDRIVGGQAAIPNSWPWQVSLQLKHVYPSGHFCGGSLINNQWVITAGHCFERRKAPAVRIKFGDHYNYQDEDGEIIRYVDQVFVHPSYDPEPKNDIALLKLSAPVTFNDKMSPVCMPDGGQALPVGSLVHITGWGDTMSAQGTSDILKQVMAPVISFEKCNEYYAGTVPPKTLCTHQNGGGRSPCMGDSGGPLVMANEEGRWVIHGLVSWGHRICGSTRGAAVYTQVSQFTDWIQRTIKNNS